MKIFEVVLSKSYLVTIRATDAEMAKRYSEFFIGDLRDISTINDRKEHNFEIEKIDCRANESFEVTEIYEKY